MAGDRYVVLGVAQARSGWFRAVAQWSNSAAIPVEFVKCVSAEEVRARLASGRTFSALVADGGLPSVDRDLIASATQAGTSVIVVDDERVSRDWSSLGAAAVLSATFAREELLDALADHAHVVRTGTTLTATATTPAAPSAWRGQVVAVSGAGGAGTSTAAIALAQALGDDVRHGGMVVLADLCLRAEQAMLHDARDVVPGIQELVEAHRAGRPSSEDVRALTFAVSERNYQLLLGLRHARFWSTIRPRAFEAAFDSLRRSYRVVVCDLDADLEGETEGGSIDVEERNTMARTAARQADAVFAVGLPTMKGLHSLVRVLHDLLGFGVDGRRIVPVLNQAPRSPKARATLAATLAELASSATAAADLATPVFLPERRVDEALRDGVRLPAALTDPLAGALTAVTARDDAAATSASPVPERVKPGSLGSFAYEDEVAG